MTVSGIPSSGRCTRIGLGGTRTRTLRSTVAKIQKDTRDHAGSLSHSVGAHRSSIFDGRFSERREEVLCEGGDRDGRGGTGEGGASEPLRRTQVVGEEAERRVRF